MKKTNRWGWLLVAISAPLIGSVRASDASDERANLNGGYFLLHSISGDEAQLPLLLDLKTSPQEISDYADRISKTAKEDLSVLDEFKAKDRTMDFDMNPLPKFEQDVRASITEEKQHQLLFGTKGHDFVRALLLSQSEATKYAANITKVLAEQETHPARVRELKRLSGKWHALFDESMRLLRNY